MPFRRSARATIMRGASKHNRRLWSAHPALAAAVLASVLGACTPSERPPEGAYAAQLVRLEGPPSPPPPTRLRVVVADAALGGSEEDPIDALELLASRVAAANADVAVVLQFPFAAQELQVTEAGESVAYDAAEAFAVDADLYYRVGWTTHDRSDALGHHAVGPLILSESPLAGPSYDGNALRTAVAFDGAEMRVVLGAGGGDDALSIGVGASCDSIATDAVRSDDGSLCLTPPAGWSVVRAGTSAVDGAVGDGLRVELHRDAQLAPSAPNP